MNLTKRLITTNVYSQRGNPTHIVLHTYGGVGRSLYNWFQTNTLGVSSHVGVFKDGNIEQYVEFSRIAGHAGNKDWNHKSVGIEHQDDAKWANPNTYTAAQYEASSQLVFTLCEKYNIPITRERIVPHNQIVIKRACPGTLDINRIIKQAKQYMNELIASRAENIKLKTQQAEEVAEYKKAIENLTRKRADAEATNEDYLTNIKRLNAELLACKKSDAPKTDFNLFISIYESIKKIFKSSN